MARPARAAATLGVVAAENAYGDIVRQIGGAHVSVTSILTDPNADPHLYEPGTRNGLAVAQARLVIQNGVGYDAFMQRLEDASPSSKRAVITIADVLGVHGKDANPHLWYDVPKLPTIAAAIAAGLEHADPAHAAAYRSGLRRFDTSLGPLQQAGGADRGVVRRQPGRVHRARPRLPPRGRGTERPRAGRLHTRDRGRDGADTAGGRRNGSADDAASR